MLPNKRHAADVASFKGRLNPASAEESPQLMRGPLGNSRTSGRIMDRRVFWIIGLLALVAGLILAKPVVTRWRADRTADRLVRVLHRKDSTAYASLSSRGSPQTFRCLQELWPAEFWSLHGQAPKLTRISAPPGELGYRMIGDTLARDGTLAVFHFFILEARPTRVQSVFVDASLGVWTPEVYACLAVGAT
jgi:hypothetical protein